MSSNTVAVDARTYRFRLVEPTTVVADTVQVMLGQRYKSTPLPTSSIATSPDLVEGSYTRRLDDAGEFQLAFPNAVASDLVPWRDRFNPDGKSQFVEIYRGYDLEFIGVVERVELDRGRIVVSGGEPWSLLKSAFERDRSWTAAPLEVINAYSCAPILEMGDDFSDGSIDPDWTFTDEGVGNMTWTEADGFLKFTSTVPEWVQMEQTLPGGVLGSSWRAQAVFAVQPQTGIATDFEIRLELGNSGADFVRLSIFGAARQASFGMTYYPGGTPIDVTPDPIPADIEAPVTLTIERQGRWMRGFVNGQLIGYVPAQPDFGYGLERIRVYHNLQGLANTLWLEQVTVLKAATFLATEGGVIGSLRAPGDYPPGGLRGRYWNIADLTTRPNEERWNLIFAPDREPYAERLDQVIDTSGGLTIPFQPGAPSSGDYFAVRWFGSIYLDPGNGSSATFELTSYDDGVRLWVGNTNWLYQVIDDWVDGGPRTSTAVVTYDSLDPDLSRAGWYPIVLEYFDYTSGNTITLKFTPGGSGTYVDPGGTTITRGTKIVVPSSSLSPLGCFDNRVQGQSHFDLVKQAASEFGLELLPTIYPLSTGSFPGRLDPVDRVGIDRDLILVVEDDEHGVPILNPGSSLDSTEQAAHLIGSAQGLNAGRGDVTAEVIDLTTARSSVFALQRWVDAGDIAFPDLLAARLNAELALGSVPWQELRGNPIAQEGLTDTFPLSDTLSRFSWTPGDAIRVKVPEVGIDDETPRRITQLSRTFGADGRTGAQVGFRNRPRGQAVELRRLARATVKPLRQKSPQLVALSGNYVTQAVAAASFTGYSICPLDPRDTVVRAELRITLNTASMEMNPEINSVSRGGAIGRVANAPVIYDVTPYAKSNASGDSRFYCRLYNGGVSTTNVEFLLIVEVLR